MSKFKHDLLLRLIKLADAVMLTIPFALCWYLYYSERIASPFYAKGDLLVVLLFLVLFIAFGRVYDAFLMSMQRISEIVYAQFLAAAVSDLIMYVVICLLSKSLPNLLPGITALAGQILLAFLWAYLAHHGYYATFPAKRTAIIYDVRQGMEKLIGEYRLDGKYDVVLTISAEECLKDLSVLDGVETVFASGIHSHDRNIILKYCIEHSISMFVIPRIGDVIMSGAHHMHMFHLPMLTVSRYMANPEYLIAKRVIDIVVSALALIVLTHLLSYLFFCVKSGSGELEYKLTEVQEKIPHFNKVMQLYIQWVINHYSEIKGNCISALKHYREIYIAAGHHRLATTFAQLQFGYALYLSFLKEYEVIDDVTAKALLSRATEIFVNMCAEQSKKVERKKPTILFTELLKELLEVKKIYLIDLDRMKTVGENKNKRRKKDERLYD